MSSVSLDQLPNGQLHCREQLNRLKQLGFHLKQFLAHYNCEPQTRDRFVLREALRDQIRELEEKCNYISEQVGRDKNVLKRLSEEVVKLHREFKRLEDSVRSYMQGALN